MKVKYLKKIAKFAYNYLVFFALVAFVITCCVSLFVSAMQRSVSFVFTDEMISLAAKLTMGNVILISLIFTLLDTCRRSVTVKRPIRKIREASEKIIDGDFSVRIKKDAGIFTDDGFGEIIDCFNKMAEELDGVESLRGDFVANVSHELKTPPALIQNYVTLLMNKNLSDDKREEYLTAIKKTSEKMAETVMNILRLTKLENQQIYPRAERFNLSEQVCECLLNYENVWEKKEIGIETEIEDDIYVSLDSELAEIVWNNLFSNAFKFTEDGGSVFVGVKKVGRDVFVSVKDTGCGMTQEVGRHIFEKFYQGDRSHSEKGNGLGLAIVKRALDIMHGEITVESTVGSGSCFTVRLERCDDVG